MLVKWTSIFLIIAVAAAIFGSANMAAGAAAIVKTIFFIFLVLVLASAILGLTVLKRN